MCLQPCLRSYALTVQAVAFFSRIAKDIDVKATNDRLAFEARFGDDELKGEGPVFEPMRRKLYIRT